MTSATPPSLTKGTASVLTIRILKRVSFMVQPSCKGGSTARSFFSLLSYHAKQNVAATHNLLGERTIFAQSARRGQMYRAHGAGGGSCGRSPPSAPWARYIWPLQLTIASLG